jgi:hypothetical protein
MARIPCLPPFGEHQFSSLTMYRGYHVSAAMQYKCCGAALHPTHRGAMLVISFVLAIRGRHRERSRLRGLSASWHGQRRARIHNVATRLRPDRVSWRRCRISYYSNRSAARKPRRRFSFNRQAIEQRKPGSMLIRYGYEIPIECVQPTALVCLLSINEE